MLVPLFGMTVLESRPSAADLRAKATRLYARQNYGQACPMFDEALALKDWVQQTKAHSVLIPTDLFHTRRVCWIFSKALRGTGAETHVTAVDPLRYTAGDWWKHEEGLIAFQNEVIKSVYYLLKY